jgi:hypothetical protein
MTVGTATPRVEYIEDGATLIHAVPFQFFDTDELIVTRIDGTSDVNNHVLTLGADYIVSGGGGDVGSITKTSTGTVGATLRIQRHTHRSQLLDYEPGDEFPAESHEEGLDRLEMQIQELEDQAVTEERVRDILGMTLVAGNGIQITVNDEANTITISTIAADALVDGLPDCVMLSGDQQSWDGITGSGSGGLTQEDVEDIVADMLTAGAGIGLAYDDAAGIFTITNTSPASGGSGGAGLTTEDVQDIVAAFINATGGLSKSYDDTANTLTIDASGVSGGGSSLSVDDESLVGNGYVKLSNGLMLQWGSANIGANATPTIFYPQPYATFSVASGSGGHNGTSNPNNCRITGCNATGFTVCNNDPSAAPFFWIALGV